MPTITPTSTKVLLSMSWQFKCITMKFSWTLSVLIWENLDYVLYFWAKLAFWDWFWSTLVLYMLVNKETTVWGWNTESGIKDINDFIVLVVSWLEPALSAVDSSRPDWLLVESPESPKDTDDFWGLQEPSFYFLLLTLISHIAK